MTTSLAEKITDQLRPAIRRDFFRLPKPAASDPFFGFSRSFYYQGEKRGWWKLIRIREPGKDRGVTLIPYADIEKFVRSQVEETK